MKLAWRSYLSATALVLAPFVVCACSSPDPHAPSVSASAATDVLVLTHSWSGRTAVVGRAWADMLGARFLRLSDGPQGYASLASDAPTSAAVAKKLDLAGVRRLYVGSPIWGRGPAPPVWQLLEQLDLTGKQIVPFFTYLHDVDGNAVEALAQRLRAKGAELLAPIEIRVPESMSPAHLERQAHHALLARPDLWSAEADPVVNCSAASTPAGHTLCAIPAGHVWLGDDGSPESPPGYTPPRRIRVAAFEIDRAEATIAQYQSCERAGRCPKVNHFDPCDKLVAEGDDKPMPCVSVDQARAYCKWVGMRLPDEAEWIRAARGEKATPYPWGSSPPGGSSATRGNFGEKRGAGLKRYSLVEPDSDWPADGAVLLAKGCSYPQGNSPFGLCDLAGNIGEWVEPVSGDWALVFKGGSWMESEPWALRIASRGWGSFDRGVASVGNYETGFRCARSTAR